MFSFLKKPTPKVQQTIFKNTLKSASETFRKWRIPIPGEEPKSCSGCVWSNLIMIVAIAHSMRMIIIGPIFNTHFEDQYKPIQGLLSYLISSILTSVLSYSHIGNVLFQDALRETLVNYGALVVLAVMMKIIANITSPKRDEVNNKITDFWDKLLKMNPHSLHAIMTKGTAGLNSLYQKAWIEWKARGNVLKFGRQRAAAVAAAPPPRSPFSMAAAANAIQQQGQDVRTTRNGTVYGPAPKPNN